MNRKSKKPMELSGSLWLQKSGQKIVAEERIALLEKIHELGSITKAAKAAGISYKTAWDSVDLMNNLADKPLVERNAGGKGGGGTALTKAGLEVVKQFQVFGEEHRRFLQSISDRIEDGDDLYNFLHRISLKISARNVFAGTVTEITRGIVNAMIVLTLKGGTAITATITNASVSALGLEAGKEAYAIVKASSVILGTDLHASKISARNILCGSVTNILDDPVNSEITVDLGEGNTISAVITHESASRLGLVIGAHACTLFKASSVILGVV